jgi:hypothetical protein
MATIAGCAASPYDLAERGAEMISADVRQAIDKLITDANDIASAQDGKVYVDVKKFARVMVFVPDSESGRPREPLLQSSAPVPRNAVLKEWTDWFALAQELSYRYSYIDILESEQHLSPPYFTAKVKVLLRVTRRWAYGGKPKDLPVAPDGYIAWWPFKLQDGYGYGPSPGFLPAPGRPYGKVATQPLPIDTISQSALASLRQSPPQESDHVVVAHMVYDHHKKRWELRKATTERDFPRPEWLRWSHGLKGEKRRDVFAPDDIRCSKPDGNPAPKE